MNKELQSRCWACLPKDAREEIRKEYNHTFGWSWDSVKNSFLETLYGHHNLTSDTEPEEMLMVEREKVIKKCDEVTKDYAETGDKWCSGYINALNNFFGDKCLPDKEPSVQGEPKFRIGQLVRCLEDWCQNKPLKVIKYDAEDNTYQIEGLSGFWLEESQLEPYTEPETKDNMEENFVRLADEPRIQIKVFKHQPLQ